MGFQQTLCQKAVGMFGEDMESAVAWLASGQAQENHRVKRSRSWQLAEELAQAMGTFSEAACRAALQKVGNDVNAAAILLLEQGFALEAEIAAQGDDQDETFRPSFTSEVDDEEEAPTVRTVSFRPAHDSFVSEPPATRSVERSASRESFSIDGKIEVDEFISAAPPVHPILPDVEETDSRGMMAEMTAVELLQKRDSTKLAMPPLAVEDCLPGRLMRPTPLAANRNCVLNSVDLDNTGNILSMRVPESDVMHVVLRPMTQCQRAEASLINHFPELRHLGANSSGLGAVSGAAHTTLGIMLARQAVLYLLADVQGLQRSDADSQSAFNLQQLGQPRDLLDLLKLAFYSSGGRHFSGGASPFAKMWSLMESLMNAESDTAQLSAFRGLPRLLRDDALGHIRRELRGCATLNSSHPLGGSKLSGCHKLSIPGATKILVQMDARSQLGGSAYLLFCLDEAGLQPVGKWQGVAANHWRNILVHGDEVWVHLKGEVPPKSAKHLWGFRVRIAAQGWKPPEVESEALEAPLPIGWHLLDLLSKHRPLELLTSQTYFFLARYLHATDAPHHPLAASLLLRLLKLPDSAFSANRVDPRDTWPMDQLLTLGAHVDWHAENATDPVSGLLPLRIQLFSEVVAHAWLRVKNGNGSPPPSRPWIDGVVTLSTAAQFFLDGTDPLAQLPTEWLAKLQDAGMDVLQIHVNWNPTLYAPLIAHAIRCVGPKAELLKIPANTLPVAERGPLAGCSASTLRIHFALVQQFNSVLQSYFSFVYTGHSERAHTLGAQLCSLRELIFAEVKQSAWAKMLDATAPIHDSKWCKANPPPVVTVNRHRAAKERTDRRGKMKHSIFAQLHSQLQVVDVDQLKRRDRAFKVKFAGEAADDYGGPYREVFTSLCSELQNEEVLPLLLLTPNGQHNLGSNRDRYVMQPASTSAELLQWYEFIGVLMGIALLQKETVLGLNLCSVIWKQLVQQVADATDLAAFDEMVCQSLIKIENIENEGVDEEMFSDLIFEVFTAQLSNGVEAEICEGGSELDVTWHNRKQYCDLVLKTRLREGRTQTQAVLRGLSAILPVRLFPLFTHREFELMVCGTPDINVTDLRRHTRYGVSVDPNEPHIQLFWQVLESFAPHERSQFLTFIWGRNRLPATEEEWADQSMKIHTLDTTTPDQHFPVSHTCFFSMEWPRYSSFSIARTKFLYAIINCTDMDMDTTAEGRANLAMSIEDD